MIKVRELRGYKSLRALNTFHTLLMGTKMLPAYMSESYEFFLLRIKAMDAAGREAVLREGVRFVPLTEEEVEAVVYFCTDGNGVPLSAENLKSYEPQKLKDCIIAVCLEIGKIEVDILSEEEKKN